MKAADIMTRAVVTASPEAPIGELARVMLQHRISGVPVIDAKGTLVGIVTEGDLLRRAETGTEKRRSRWLDLLISPGRHAQDYTRTHARKVGEVMSDTVVAVTPGTPVAEIVALMESRRIKRLPVLNDGRVVGMVSRADLLRALAGLLPKVPAAAVSDAEIRKSVLAEIDKQRWAPRASVDVVVEDAVVELCGAITDEREREALRVVCENVPGVKQVLDHLVWVEPISGIVIDPPKDSGER